MAVESLFDMADVYAEERWWLTEDGKERVKDGDPRARYLFYAKGDRIDPERFDEVPEAKAIEEPPHNKAVHHRATKKE
jgi:hypothetical protein